MATTKPTLQAAATLTVSGGSTLGSGTYAVSTAYNNSNNAYDILITISASTTNTPAGNTQVMAFIDASMDGTVYSGGPNSGITTTNERALIVLGAVPVTSASTTFTETFSILSAVGYIPNYFKLVVKDDLGVSLTGFSASTSEVWLITA